MKKLTLDQLPTHDITQALWDLIADREDKTNIIFAVGSGWINDVPAGDIAKEHNLPIEWVQAHYSFRDISYYVCNSAKWPSDLADKTAEPKALNDHTLRAFWKNNGGEFYGPNVETGSMPEAKLLPLLRTLIEDNAALPTVNVEVGDAVEHISLGFIGIVMRIGENAEVTYKSKEGHTWSAHENQLRILMKAQSPKSSQ